MVRFEGREAPTTQLDAMRYDTFWKMCTTVAQPHRPDAGKDGGYDINGIHSGGNEVG
jgi:hypothetical protein